MRCDICGAPSRVLSTRAGSYGSLARRRECENRHRFTTYEIHRAPFSNSQLRIRQFAESRAIRTARWRRDAAIVRDPRSSSLVGRDYGIQASRVRQIRRTHF